MKRMSWIIAAVAIGGCHKATTPPPAKAAPPPAAAPVAKSIPAPVAKPAPAPALDPASSPAILARLHAIDAEELEVAQQAKSAAKSKQVKSLAGQVATSRAKLDQNVAGLAKKLNVPLQTPSQLHLAPTDAQDAQAIASELAAVKEKKGGEFDPAFLTALDDADKREEALVKMAAAKASSPDIKKLAGSEVASLESESQLAEKDLKRVEPKKRAHK